MAAMTRLALLAVLSLWCAPAAPAQDAAPTLTLAGTAITDPGRGISLRLFASSRAIPVRRMRKQQDRRLFWYEGQCARSWVVQTGGRNPKARMRVLLGELKFPPTNAWMAGNNAAPPAGEWAAPMVKAWVQFFSELPVTAVEGDHYTLRSETLAGHAWVRTLGTRRWCVLYKYPAAWESSVAEVVAQSAASFAAAPQGDPLTAPDPAIAGLPPSDPGGPLSFQAERTRYFVGKSLEGLPDWWSINTAHYVIVSNLDPKVEANAEAVRRIANGLEAVRTAYLALFPPKQPVKAVSVVKIFDHRDQLFAHFSERSPMKMNLGIIGMWVNVYDELVLFHDPAKSKLPNTLTTLYHEGFHQYVHYALGEMSIPRWFDEGTGDFFGGAVVEAGGVRIGENRTRKHNVTKIVNGTFTKQYQWTPPTLERLVSMTRQEFYADVKWLVFRYSMCWGLIYYLRKGVEADSPYAGILDRYVDTLHSTRSADAARKAAFGPVDMEALERDYRAFWLDPERRKAAEARRLIPAREK
jgi:hypothetical protein